MKKNELIDAIAREKEIPRGVIRDVLDAAADVVRKTLSDGGSVFLFGLGKLEVSSRGAKKARNIRTGELVMVPPRRVAVYRQSTSVEHALNHDAAGAAPAED